MLNGVSGLRAFAFVKGNVAPPVALVMLPETIEYDVTYARGADRITLDVVVAVGKADSRSAFDAISAYASGSGSSSIKAAIEAGTYTSLHTVRVTSATFDVITIGAVDYLGATFQVDIVGSGS